MFGSPVQKAIRQRARSIVSALAKVMSPNNFDRTEGWRNRLPGLVSRRKRAAAACDLTQRWSPLIIPAVVSVAREIGPPFYVNGAMAGQLGIGLLYPAGLGSRAGFRRLTFRGRYLGVQSFIALPLVHKNYKKVQK